MKIIGPISAHQHCITINGTTRHILLFGDRHQSIGSCYMPSDHWISQYKNNFLKFYYTDNQNESIDDQKIRLDKLKIYIETIIKEVKFNKDVMFIYDYILLLAKGNVCVDFFDEIYTSQSLAKLCLSPDDPHSGIYYMKILDNIFTFCNKPMKYYKFLNASIDIDQEWCSKTFPAIRHHITDIRTKIKFCNNDKTVIPNNNFMKYIISFITSIIYNNKSILIELNCIEHFPDIEKGLDEIYKLLQKQFKKSYLYIINDKESLISNITEILIEETLNSLFWLKARIMDFYLLFRIFILNWEQKKTLSDSSPRSIPIKCIDYFDYPRYSIVYLGDNHIKYINKYITAIFPTGSINTITSLQSNECCAGLDKQNTKLADELKKKQDNEYNEETMKALSLTTLDTYHSDTNQRCVTINIGDT